MIKLKLQISDEEVEYCMSFIKNSGVDITEVQFEQFIHSNPEVGTFIVNNGIHGQANEFTVVNAFARSIGMTVSWPTYGDGPEGLDLYLKSYEALAVIGGYKLTEEE